jgi:hypothetical protein
MFLRGCHTVKTQFALSIFCCAFGDEQNNPPQIKLIQFDTAEQTRQTDESTLQKAAMFGLQVAKNLWPQNLRLFCDSLYRVYNG